MDKKIKVAFVKFGGMAAGGIEKYLQTLACNLPKDRFEVDYFYTHGVPLIGSSWVHPTTDPDRLKYMDENGINTILIDCEARENRYGVPYLWINHNFFELFAKKKYDIVQTGRCGHLEYPFHLMPDTLFVDSIHSDGSFPWDIDKRENIFKTVLLSEDVASTWVSNGGDKEKVVVIPPIIEFPKIGESSLKSDLGIDEKFVFGMHQGDRDDIYSPTPLEAFSKLGMENAAYVLLGGSQRYRSQAKSLGLENVYFIDFTGDAKIVNNFVSGLDIFAHGRYDGEVQSAALIEALRHGKPIISHPGINMGHVKQIEGCGFMAHSVEEYTGYMKRLYSDSSEVEGLSTNCIDKYDKQYSLSVAIEKYVKIYEEAYKNEKQ